jgi:uncharacterized protein DUF2017
VLERRRIERTRDGGVRLRLPRDERALLRSLPAQLRALLDEAPEDPSLERLFPPAYDDAEDEDEYRRLMGDELLDGRRRALRVVEETLDQDRLSGEQAQAWLTALNDLRLVLGTRLDVRDETLLAELRPDNPRAPELAVYAYLSWLQEQLVEALAADFQT